MVRDDLPAVAPKNPSRRVTFGNVERFTGIRSDVSDFPGFDRGAVVDDANFLF